MELTEKGIKNLSAVVIIGLMGILTFIVVQPILLSVFGALILAYLFMPVQRYFSRIIHNQTVSALIICTVILLLITIPTWFLIPIVSQQVFSILKASQTLDAQNIMMAIFPTATQQFAAQAGVALNGFITKISAATIDSLLGIFLDVPTIALQLFIIFFVFFFALRDGDKLKEFVSDLSPFAPAKEKMLVQHFKDVTDSVIYGQIIIGLVQGALAGLGFLIFGIKNVLVLTLFATLLSILPILGPFIVWIPVSIYLFASGNQGLAFGYLLYNLIIVSTVDNILRSYFISRKTSISPAIIFVGMMGGVFVFGIFGLILGPLILAYFLVFLKSYKDKTLYDLFSKRGESSVG